jgi:hypothetical protein
LSRDFPSIFVINEAEIRISSPKFAPAAIKFGSEEEELYAVLTGAVLLLIN